MDKQAFVPLVCLCVLTHIIRTIYEIAKHKKIVRPDKLSFVIIFINMAVLWISWFALCSADIYRINLPDIVRYFGLSFCIIGLIIFLIALATIKTLENYDGELIVKGIYSRIRHPMYLGFILLLIGFPVYQGAVYSFALALIFIINILFWRYLEEKELEERFVDYKIYSVRTLF